MAREVARAVLKTASLSNADIVLEIGAGTGAIGSELIRLGVRYVGLERLRDWATREYGSLLHEEQSTEHDTIEGVRFSSATEMRASSAALGTP